MKRRSVVFKRGLFALLRDAFGTVVFTLAVTAIVIVGLAQAGSSSRAEGLRLLEEGIKRAVVECYALEGRYPDTIAYVEENYGIVIDRSKYAVHYSVFASNIMPAILVAEISGGGRP